ncbi:MAG: aldehyde ferredoxin oxidoreductase C-terminal domain-containing protein, partial [Atribacterota bacterium]|nr:aldehyde ferredoxin oxidoreductase C-terminal domain-containing protein [Atribacterota bacterium]
YGLWYLWQAVKSETRWNDPENELIFCTGPLCGITQYSGCGKSHVVSLSPETGSANDNNAGGYFAPYLKFSGWDALEIQGKSEQDVIIFIDGNKGELTIQTYPYEDKNSYLLVERLTEYFAEDEQDKANISIVSAGEGAENSLLGILNFSWYDRKREKVRYKQAARGGPGTVLRDKKIVAIIIKYKGITGSTNNPASPELLKKAGQRITQEILSLDDVQNGMRQTGTINLIDHMNTHNCLPVHNFQFGSHKQAIKIFNQVWKKRFSQKQPGDSCWVGCNLRCSHAVDRFILKTGPLKGEEVIVDGPEYETAAGMGGNCGCFDPDVVLEANFYCDHYGIDTIGVSTTIAFLMECYDRGILNQERTGGLDLRFGNGDALLELIHLIAQGEEFGKIAGQGIRRCKKYFVENFDADPDFLEDIGMECKGMEFSEYVTKESLAQQGGYGIANKGPQHDESWLIFMDQVNKQIPTFEDKAEALYYFPLFRTWFSLVGLCKLPWNDIEPADNKQKYSGITAAKIPEHVENYCWLFEGITGKKISTEDIISQSEAVHNLQRLFNLKMGYGTRKHDAIPYRAMGPVKEQEYCSRADFYDKQLQEEVEYDIKGKDIQERIKALRKFREKQYELLCDAVYRRRGWDENGVPNLETIKRLQIDFPEILSVWQNYHNNK